MFDAVLNKSTASSSRFGVGSVVTVIVYAALLSLVLWLSSRPAQVHAPDPEVKFFAAVPAAPPPPPPPPPPAKPKTERKVEKKVEKKPDVLVQPKEIPTQKPPEAEPKPDEPAGEEAGQDDGVEGGVEGGVAGGVVGGVVGGTVGGTVGAVGGTDVVPFGEGMTIPQLDKAAIARNAYTREAREAQVEGMLIVKCSVMADGQIRNCRVIKPLPHLAEHVVELLHQTRIAPVTYQGKPVAVDYVFNFMFKMPR